MWGEGGAGHRTFVSCNCYRYIHHDTIPGDTVLSVTGEGEIKQVKQSWKFFQHLRKGFYNRGVLIVIIQHMFNIALQMEVLANNIPLSNNNKKLEQVALKKNNYSSWAKGEKKILTLFHIFDSRVNCVKVWFISSREWDSEILFLTSHGAVTRQI